jgi:peptidoglycan/xylan/chitin deacetylase (PgdA/CDA1 family)
VWGIQSLFASPSRLEAQLGYLRDNGYTTVTFEDFPLSPYIEKPIILTFDDGYRCNYVELFPLLKKYEMKATIFLITSQIGNARYLTREQIVEMSNSGLVSFQSHTASHPHLAGLSPERVEEEFFLSSEVIWALTGKAPIALAFPFGSFDQTTVSIASGHYRFMVTTRYGVWAEDGNPFAIPRINIARDTTLRQFISLLG